MKYEQRLKAAASTVLAADARAADAPVDGSELGLRATLKPHQVEGVSWLIRRYNLGVNVILGDEMGLGKTLQAISLLSYLKVSQVSSGPFCELEGVCFVMIHSQFLISVSSLIILLVLFFDAPLVVLCPLSVTDGWVSEIVNFAPNLKVLRYVGEKENRCSLRKMMYYHLKQHHSSTDALSLPFDVLLTTYDIVLVDQEFLSQIPWQYAIVDEAQRLKNPSSVLYKVLMDQYIIPRRLLMTGTPIQNNLTEIWALMHFCMPLVFGTLEEFLSTFKEAAVPSSVHDETEVRKQVRSLRCVLRAFMLRRTKSKLIEGGTLVLPPLTEITVMAPMVDLQKKVYLSILKKELLKLLALSSGASSTQSLQNIVIQLRKACSHPYLFPGIEPEPYEEGEHLVEVSGKLIILDQLLWKLHSSGHRVLLFAQMTHTLDILQDYLELRRYSYERLDGSIRAQERFAAIRSFSQQSVKDDWSSGPNENGAFVFMISTRAGGVGLNLVAADTVIFFEQDWNPQVDKQALQRAHRIGQISHVLSINLVTAHTVEEVIMRRARRKMLLSQNVVGDGSTEKGGESEGVETADFRSIIYGLQMFDPTEINEKLGESKLSEVNAVVEKIIAMRHELGKDERKFEIDPANVSDTSELSAEISSASVAFDPGFDESSYLSWVEKFKDASQASTEQNEHLEPRRALENEDRRLSIEVAKKKAEEKKLLKWESLGYNSSSVKEPILPIDRDISLDLGVLHFVYGDCTQPSKVCPSENTIIFSCVDDSGKWGHGGMFDALAKLSPDIPAAYERAAEFGDLHLGDLHLIKIDGCIADHENAQNVSDDHIEWVALAVVQSYNSRRKVPRGNISLPDLERCLSKASYSAAQNSASIHMPRVGYQDGSDRAEWYTVERLLRKYAAIFGIKIFVYYYRRQS